MDGPDSEFRAEIAEAVQRVETEAQLDELLARVEDAIAADLAQTEESQEKVLDGVLQWASVTSYAVAYFYEPASRRRDLAGFGKEAVEKLRRISAQLSGPLSFALSSTGAGSFSISVGFPWGISVGLSWP